MIRVQYPCRWSFVAIVKMTAELFTAYSRDKIARHLDEGGDPSVCNDEGVPLICHVAAQGHIVLLRRLLDVVSPHEATHGIERYSRGIDGWTPLHYAVDNNRPECVRLLLSRGADVNALTDHGYTPLMYAMRRGGTAMMRTLLERGAWTNAVTGAFLTDRRESPLSRCKTVSQVQCLLEAGAQVTRLELAGLYILYTGVYEMLVAHAPQEELEAARAAYDHGRQGYTYLNALQDARKHRERHFACTAAMMDAMNLNDRDVANLCVEYLEPSAVNRKRARELYGGSGRKRQRTV